MAEKYNDNALFGLIDWKKPALFTRKGLVCVHRSEQRLPLPDTKGL